MFQVTGEGCVMYFLCNSIWFFKGKIEFINCMSSMLSYIEVKV